MNTSEKNNVRVPGSFPKTHIKESLQTVGFIFQDKSWPLKLISHEHYGNLSARWAAFRRETPSQLEDAVCSNFIEKDDFVFRVSIFRTTDETWVNNNTMQYDAAEEAWLLVHFWGEPNIHNC